MLTFFFFNDTATTEIYTLSLHDAPSDLEPTRRRSSRPAASPRAARARRPPWPRRSPATPARARRDRKSTRLNSSHANISYAVFCLKKKNQVRRINLHTSEHEALVMTITV